MSNDPPPQKKGQKKRKQNVKGGWGRWWWAMRAYETRAWTSMHMTIRTCMGAYACMGV